MTNKSNPPVDRAGGAEESAPPVSGEVRLPARAPRPQPRDASEIYGSVPSGADTSADGTPEGDAPMDPANDGHGLPLGHEATTDELLQRLEQAEIAVTLLEAERDEYRADLQRKAAELSNVLKREQRTAGAGRLEGRMDVMRGLLDVLDDLERTMAAVAASEDEALRSGVALVHDKLAGALRAQGLVRTGEVGEPFDPNHHEAVQQIDAEDGPLDGPVVDQVFRPGYLVGDRVLRAAMVVVRQ